MAIAYSPSTTAPKTKYGFTGMRYMLDLAKDYGMAAKDYLKHGARSDSLGFNLGNSIRDLLGDNPATRYLKES